ncbi:MAG: polysaccharide deacetylase family protein [Clostridiales bacterium]|jgi:peptidoglycan-N-acetylmuramic acid deacetylase|nr:polysaccharide deacetylase family protein [Clostridiales bacterium]
MRYWFLLLCVALLPACGRAPLQKPVDAEAFARETTPETSGSGPSSLIQTVTPADIPSKTPAPTDVLAAPEHTAAPEISAEALNTSGLSNEKLSWYIVRNQEHLPPRGAAEMDISAYGGYYLGDTAQKYIWLTFDAGYENGYTSSILDTLKEKDIRAAFFCVGTYIRDNPELTKRMLDEGHLVANHSEKHPSMPDIDDNDILDQIYEPARRYKELTGLDMPAFFRPPSGEYSERTMYITKEAGYKTIFWSFAYQDWLTDDQPGKDYAFNTVMDNLHNGEILLLHAVSSSNAEALPDIIDAVKTRGYEFKSLLDLP